MSEWREYKLGDTCEVTTGFAFKSEQYESTGNLKVVRGENVTIGKLRWDSEKHWNRSTENLARYFLKEGDIVISMDGSRVGQNRAIIRQVELPLILAQRVARLRAKDGFNQKFLWYHIFSNYFRDYVEAIHTGTSIPHISQRQIADFEITAPSEIEQKAIASILSSLDDKIDLLHRQNATLEAMAETLFRQWFMEEAKEEWEEGVLGDIIEFNPLYAIKKGALAPYLEMSNVSESSFYPKDWYLREFTSGMKFQNGDTLIARITPCLENGKTCLVTFLGEDQIGWGSTEFIVMRIKKPFHPFISYIIARNKDFRDFAVSSMSGSSGRQRAHASIIKEYPIAIPPEEVIQKLNLQFERILEKLKNNANQFRSLTTLRNILLPKLMSGEIKIN